MYQVRSGGVSLDEGAAYAVECMQRSVCLSRNADKSFQTRAEQGEVKIVAMKQWVTRGSLPGRSSVEVAAQPKGLVWRHC